VVGAAAVLSADRQATDKNDGFFRKGYRPFKKSGNFFEIDITKELIETRCRLKYEIGG